MDGEGDAAVRPAGWTGRYGETHRWRRVAAWPPGMAAPKKVRVYQRTGHFLLNWWDPAAKKNRTERVAGDWLAAVMRARDIEASVASARSTHAIPREGLTHDALVARFLADLACRADAREVAPRTVARYRSALDHYLAYCHRAEVERAFPTADGVTRDFQLGLRAYLLDRAAGGSDADRPGPPLKGSGFVLDTVRAVYAWAADPDRGHALPPDFRHPFARGGGKDTAFVGDPLADPAITMSMAADFLRAADTGEKLLFAPMVLFGLRAAEPCYLFAEHVTDDWLLVPNLPDVDYFTKGRRDKRFPWTDELRGLRDALRAARPAGLLYRRPAGLGTAAEYDLAAYRAEYRRRLAAAPARDHRTRLAVQRQLHRDAGGLTYDAVDASFRRVTARLGWAAGPTLKDFRHLFATTLANANLAEGYRKYLLGHAPGGEAAVAYTHLNQIREGFAAVLRTEFRPVLDALEGLGR